MSAPAPNHDDRPIDILSIGEPLAEFVQTVPTGSPAPTGFGGDALNVAVAAARQGARAAIFTAIGDDAHGRRFLSLCADEGIDTSCVITRPNGKTGAYVISYSDAGHAFSYDRAGSAASQIAPQEIPTHLISTSRALHVSGVGQAISTTARNTIFEAIRQAKAAGTLVSYDSNLRLKLWPLETARSVIHTAMRDADIARLSLDDARQLTGADSPEEIARYYLLLGAGSVALTLGADGSLIARGDEMMRLPAPKLDALDASGAGDVFTGALLAEYLAHGDLALAARYATMAAALQTQSRGTIAAMPSRREVKAALTERAP